MEFKHCQLNVKLLFSNKSVNSASFPSIKTKTLEHTAKQYPSNGIQRNIQFPKLRSVTQGVGNTKKHHLKQHLLSIAATFQANKGSPGASSLMAPPIRRA